MFGCTNGRFPYYLILLVGVLASITGCRSMSFMHPIDIPPRLPAFAENIPCTARDHVHIFFIHGLDPLDSSNLHGLREYCEHIGFRNTYLGQWFHGKRLKKELVRIRCEDPTSRFVLVGYSVGADVAQNMAIDLEDEDIDIDLMFYLGGWMVENERRHRPRNVHRVIHVLAMGYDEWWGEPIDGAENIKLTDVQHFGSPSHPQTLATLRDGLFDIAGTVPIVVELPAQAAAELVPERLPVRVSTSRKDWNFLRPAVFATSLSKRREERRKSGRGGLLRGRPMLTKKNGR